MSLLIIWASWKKLEFWTQTGIIGAFVGIVLSVLSLSGVHVHLIDLAVLFLLGGCLLLTYGNIQQSRELIRAKRDLGEVDNRIDSRVQSVYHDCNEKLATDQSKIDRLEIAYRYLDNAYRKKESITSGSVSTKFSATLVAEGSPEHLKNISQDVSYAEAKRLAREAGIRDDA